MQVYRAFLWSHALPLVEQELIYRWNYVRVEAGHNESNRMLDRESAIAGYLFPKARAILAEKVDANMLEGDWRREWISAHNDRTPDKCWQMIADLARDIADEIYPQQAARDR